MHLSKHSHFDSRMAFNILYTLKNTIYIISIGVFIQFFEFQFILLLILNLYVIFFKNL